MRSTKWNNDRETRQLRTWRWWKVFRERSRVIIAASWESVDHTIRRWNISERTSLFTDDDDNVTATARAAIRIDYFVNQFRHFVFINQASWGPARAEALIIINAARINRIVPSSRDSISSDSTPLPPPPLRLRLGWPRAINKFLGNNGGETRGIAQRDFAN